MKAIDANTAPYGRGSIRFARLRSLAKINLDLRILHRRADGFHELRTVFQTVSLADTIDVAFEPARKTSFEIDDSLNIQDNLVLRAAEAALDAMKMHGRGRFKLRKQIPIGAGMGGGSSNAAAVLLALPVLAGKAIAFDKLLALGAELGSDVPFFLTGGTAVAVDRGAEFYSLADIKEEPILVVASGIHVATGAAYQSLKRPLGPLKRPTARGLTLPESSHIINGFQLFVRALGESGSARAASSFSANDFEPVVFSQYPQLQALFHRLQRAALASSRSLSSSRSSGAGGSSARRKAAATMEGDGVRMTGSGSALFALFRSKAERDAARHSLERGLEQDSQRGSGRDREFQDSGIIPARLVSRGSYQRLWHRQLAAHSTAEKTWPPQSRYAR